MIDLKPTLDTPEALESALEGLRHLPAETLTNLLLTYFNVDLDVLSAVLATPEHGLDVHGHAAGAYDHFEQDLARQPVRASASAA